MSVSSFIAYQEKISDDLSKIESQFPTLADNKQFQNLKQSVEDLRDACIEADQIMVNLNDISMKLGSLKAVSDQSGTKSNSLLQKCKDTMKNLQTLINVYHQLKDLDSKVQKLISLIWKNKEEILMGIIAKSILDACKDASNVAQSIKKTAENATSTIKNTYQTINKGIEELASKVGIVSTANAIQDCLNSVPSDMWQELENFNPTFAESVQLALNPDMNPVEKFKAACSDAINKVL